MQPKGTKLKREATLVVSGRGPVRLKVTALSSTSSLVEVGVDYSIAPVPSFHYDSDYCDVVESRTGVVLIFGRLRTGQNALRTKIEIEFSAENFAKMVWGASRGVHDAVEKLSRGKNLTPIEGATETDRVQCFRSNNVFMAVLPSEAVLDFYYISPGDIHFAQMKKKSEVALEPVVRVLTSTPLLYEFLERCRPLGERFTAMMEEEER